MKRTLAPLSLVVIASVATVSWYGFAQPPVPQNQPAPRGEPRAPRPDDQRPDEPFRGPGGPGRGPQGPGGFGAPGFGGGPGGFGGGPGGFGGGPGGLRRQERKVLEQFDRNGDGWLNREERTEAREFLKTFAAQRGGFGPPRGGFDGPPPGGFDGPPPGGFGGPPPGGFDGPPPRPEFGPPPRPDVAPDRFGPGSSGGFGPGGFGPRGFGPGGFGPGGPFGGPPGRGGPGGPGGPFGSQRDPAAPGLRISPADVEPASGGLYDAGTLRTLFLDFENEDWEAELADFRDSDVEVPATLTVDGKRYPLVGVHFRGNSSYFMVPSGNKRSLNLSLDLVDPDQRLLGYKTLNLLNGAEDASMLSSVLFSHIASQYLPTPRANLVRVVINGENWGIYSNVQQFNKEFLAEHYENTKGTRWKVPGSPNARGGLEYLGEEIDAYRASFEMKGDSDKAWKRLITLCRTLDQTPPEELPEALKPLVDIDELLWFLALDVALMNSDGYWTRASDYSIWLDSNGRFHFFPYDMNEAFRAGGGPGGPGGPGGRGGPGRPGSAGPGGPGGPGGPREQGGRRGGPGDNLELDPLVGLDDPRLPLRGKVLAVPEFRRRYWENLRTLAERSLTWEAIGPVVASYRELIEEELAADTKKLGTQAAFLAATSDQPVNLSADRPEEPAPAFGPPRRGPTQPPIREFVERRGEYLRRVASAVLEANADVRGELGR